MPKRSARFANESTSARKKSPPAAREGRVRRVKLDTYLHAFRAPDRFTPGTNLKAWLQTILTNLVRNRGRDRVRSRVQTNAEQVARTAESRVSEEASP